MITLALPFHPTLSPYQQDDMPLDNLGPLYDYSTFHMILLKSDLPWQHWRRSSQRWHNCRRRRRCCCRRCWSPIVSAIRRPSIVVCHHPSTIRCRPSSVSRRRPSFVRRSLSVVRLLSLSVIRPSSLSVVCRPSSFVVRPSSVIVSCWLWLWSLHPRRHPTCKR